MWQYQRSRLQKEARACGKLGCSFFMWRLHQAGLCFSREWTEEPDPREHPGVWLSQLSRNLGALRLTPEGGMATWTWSADQVPAPEPQLCWELTSFMK